MWEFEGATISGAFFFVVDVNTLFRYTLNIESGYCRVPGHTTGREKAAGVASSDSQERLAVAIHLNLSYTVRVTVTAETKLKPLSFGSHPSGNVPSHGEPRLEGFFMGALLTAPPAIAVSLHGLPEREHWLPSTPEQAT